MRTIAGITATSASVMSLPSSHGPPLLLDLRIHALDRAAEAVERRLHLGVGEARAPHGQHELLAQRLGLRHGVEILFAHGLEARQEGEVEGRHPHRCRRHLIDEVHQRAHPARATGSCGVNSIGSGAISSRYSMMTQELITIAAVVVERGHDAVGIERKIVGLELVAGEEVELHLLEGRPLALSTKRTRWLQVDCGAL